MTSAAKSNAPEEAFVDELKPGTELLHGQYKIRKYLNAGGFGITYLAADSLDRTIVIKECFPGAFCRRSNLMVQVRSRAYQNELGTIVQLFLKEARSLSKLRHPNIVGVHQVFEGNNTAYMALDFIEGEDLFNLIERRDPRLTPDVVRSILEKLLDAIGAVHAAGLLHRDISPDNIIVTNALEPILIDFGAAREQATRKTRALSALRIVKDGYSPQEFYIAGSQQGPSSDLYSLAATFYHLITNELPPNSQERIAAQVEGRPDPYVPLSKKTSAYDAAFCDALDRAIGVLPKSRFQSAHEWLSAISASANQPTLRPQSRPLSRPSSTPQFARQTSAAYQVSSEIAPAQPVKSGRRALRLVAGGSAALSLIVGSVVLMGALDSTNAPADAAARIAEPAPDKAEAAAAFKTAVGGSADASVASAGEAPFIPAPAVLGTETVPDLGVVTMGWTFALPFTAKAEGDLTVASATGAASSLQPGMKITKVDGQAVSTLTEAVARIQAATPGAGDQVVKVKLSVLAATGAETVEELELGVIRTLTLDTGLSFTSEVVDGAWVTRVAAAPEGMSGGIRAGDVLVAAMPGREPLGDLEALRSVILREAKAGKTTVSLAIRRDGVMFVEELALGASAG